MRKISHIFVPQKQRGRSAYGRRLWGLFPASLPFVGAALAVARSCAGAARSGGRALQVSRPKDGRPHGADPTDLIRLASLGTFPLEGGRLACDRKGRPYGFTKVHLSNRRAGEGTRPYGGKRTGSVGSAEPGAEVEPHRPQFSTYPGPSGPAGIQTSHSDFARRKFCATLLVRVPRNGVRGKATMSTKCSSGAVPGGVLLNLSRTPGEAQRSGFAGKRRSKGAVAVFAVRRKRRQADSR